MKTPSSCRPGRVKILMRLGGDLESSLTSHDLFSSLSYLSNHLDCMQMQLQVLDWEQRLIEWTNSLKVRLCDELY